jgi:hypothetical protein
MKVKWIVLKEKFWWNLFRFIWTHKLLDKSELLFRLAEADLPIVEEFFKTWIMNQGLYEELVTKLINYKIKRTR